MFPHTITIYRHTIVNGSDVYSRQVVAGVSLQETSGMNETSKGTTNSKSITVITSPELAQSNGTAWTVQEGDRIVKGIGADITKLADIKGGFVVTSVAYNVVGCPVDNIVITGV